MTTETRFEALVAGMGRASWRLTELGAAEGGAGNVSVYVAELTDIDERFCLRGAIDLPVAVPPLAGGWVIVSGSGRRLRDIASSPETTLCLLRVHLGGTQADLYAAEGMRPSSEVNSHLAVHADHVVERRLGQHALVHVQPVHLTYLSHHPAYGDTERLNRRLLRWQPETVIVFPDGVGLLPFEVPGSQAQMAQTVEGLRRHRLVVWQRHGVVARSDTSIEQTADLVEYAEVAARYETLNLSLGAPAEGLSDDEIRRIAAQWGVQPRWFE